MRRVGWLPMLALGLAGCTSASQERARDYTHDAFQQYQLGRYADARDGFQAALVLRPDDVGLLFNVGTCYDVLGNGAKAEQYYGECLRREPNHGLCRHALAVLWVREGRSPEAVRMIQDWLASQPQLVAAYTEDGWLRHQLGDLPGAQGRLQQALAIDPQDSRALVEMALVYEDKNRPDLALALYDRSLQFDPNQPDVARRANDLRARGVAAPRPG
jgi:tetratricopeptide (TPR) repeat protein